MTRNMYGGLHPKADIHWLYLLRKEGSRGLRKVAAIRFQCAGIVSAKRRKKILLYKQSGNIKQSKDTFVKRKKWKNGKLRTQQTVTWVVQTASS